MSKTFIQRLISDEEGRKFYFREHLIFEIAEAICKVAKEKHLTRPELSKIADVSKRKINQLLKGDYNVELSTVVDLLYACGLKLEVSENDLEVDGQKITKKEKEKDSDSDRCGCGYCGH